jgi:hypothetical protein
MALILHPSVAWPEPRDVTPLHARPTSSGVSDDVAFAIMGFLDAVSLLAVGTVCKTWKEMHNYGVFVVFRWLPATHCVNEFITGAGVLWENLCKSRCVAAVAVVVDATGIWSVDFGRFALFQVQCGPQHLHASQ